MPVVVGLFDYLENAGIITMLVNYPDFSKGLVAITSLFTLAKSILTTIYFVLLIVMTALYLLKRRQTSST